MNVRLVLSLSLLGVLVAAASIAGMLRTGMETACWAVVAIVCSLVLAQRAPGKFFLHGFLALFVATLLSGVLQGVFMNTYLAHNPDKLDAIKKLPAALSPALAVVVFAPFAAAINGVLAGLLTWLASKFMRRAS